MKSIIDEYWERKRKNIPKILTCMRCYNGINKEDIIFIHDADAPDFCVDLLSEEVFKKYEYLCWRCVHAILVKGENI